MAFFEIDVNARTHIHLLTQPHTHMRECARARERLHYSFGTVSVFTFGMFAGLPNGNFKLTFKHSMLCVYLCFRRRVT